MNARNVALIAVVVSFLVIPIAAQQAAIPQALVDAGRPVRTIDIESLDEAALGGLMMHFMLETILAANLLGVDPFDQPAVEAGKVLTRRRLET